MWEEDDRSDDPMFKKWAKAIKVNNSFECCICGKRGVYLESHHLDSWDWCIENRYALENGVSICGVHHRQFHDTYGYGNNTKWQFDQFKKIAEKFQLMLSRRVGVEPSLPDDD